MSKIACNRTQKELFEWQVNPRPCFKHKVSDNLQRSVLLGLYSNWFLYYAEAERFSLFPLFLSSTKLGLEKVYLQTFNLWILFIKFIALCINYSLWLSCWVRDVDPKVGNWSKWSFRNFLCRWDVPGPIKLIFLSITPWKPYKFVQIP